MINPVCIIYFCPRSSPTQRTQPYFLKCRTEFSLPKETVHKGRIGVGGVKKKSNGFNKEPTFNWKEGKLKFFMPSIVKILENPTALKSGDGFYKV